MSPADKEYNEKILYERQKISMKERKITEVYLTQKENKTMDAVFMGMTVVGVILIALWTFFYIGIGFIGLPLAIIGGAGVLIVRSSKVTDEDFDDRVKKIMLENGIEENDFTLKEYVVGKSDHIKLGKDKKIRTAFYSVTVFEFKNNEKCIIKKYLIDLFGEKVSETVFTVPVGCEHTVTENTYSTAIGDVTRYFLNFNGDPDIAIPVNINVYDTEAVIKKVTHKR